MWARVYINGACRQPADPRIGKLPPRTASRNSAPPSNFSISHPDSIMSTKVIEHPTLGKIKGAVEVPGVTTLHNLQYGALPYGRFTQSVVRDELAPKGETWDATKPGYAITLYLSLSISHHYTNNVI